MTAQAIAPLPPDPAPPPARAQDPASGQQFSQMLAPTRNAGNGAAKNTTAADASGGTSSAGNAPAKKAPAKAAASDDTGAGDDPPSATSSRKTSDDSAANAAAIVPLPLPIPLPAPPSPAAAATPGAGAPAAPVSPPSSPSTAANAANLAALLTSNAAAPQGAAAATPPPAAGAIASALAHTANAAVKATAAASAAAAVVDRGSGNGAAGKSSADATSKSAASAPKTASAASANTVPLPSMAAQLGARMAAAAPTLASQPSAALASLAHEAQKAAQEKTPALDGASATGGHAGTALDALHAATKPTAATPGDKFLASLAKDDAAAPAPSHGDDPAAPSSAQAGDPANAAGTNPTAAPATTLATASSNPGLAPELPLAAPPLLPHAVAEQVALNLRQAAKDGSDHIQIQLQPADLGTIDVKLNVSHEGRVMVVVSADRSDTLNLLQQDASNLAQALRDAGLQADNSSLSFNLRGGYQFNQQQPMNGGASYAPLADNGPAEPEAILPFASARRSHSGSLDIHV